ncbi:MAG: DNA-directed RNA polymerase, subunit E'' [Candidatus Diapherotrites archaeon]|nr:DNA-directed RNA polymerase, subunit E'' [Candidatus Diapherotrites archaeon]
MASKACKNCKFVIDEGDVCPACGGTELTTNWKGFVVIFDASKSNIAQKMGLSMPGKYALRLSK